MGFDGSLRFDKVKMPQRMNADDVLGALRNLASHADMVMREADIKFIALLNLDHVFLAQLQAESLDVGPEMLHLPATNDGEDVRRLAQVPA